MTQPAPTIVPDVIPPHGCNVYEVKTLKPGAEGKRASDFDVHYEVRHAATNNLIAKASEMKPAIDEAVAVITQRERDELALEASSGVTQNIGSSPTRPPDP